MCALIARWKSPKISYGERNIWATCTGRVEKASDSFLKRIRRVFWIIECNAKVQWNLSNLCLRLTKLSDFAGQIKLLTHRENSFFLLYFDIDPKNRLDFSFQVLLKDDWPFMERRLSMARDYGAKGCDQLLRSCDLDRKNNWNTRKILNHYIQIITDYVTQERLCTIRRNTLRNLVASSQV